MCDEITYSFPNFNDNVEIWEWIITFTLHFVVAVISYSMLWSNLVHVSKKGSLDS